MSEENRRLHTGAGLSVTAALAVMILSLGSFFCGSLAEAQQAKTYGSPLDTLMATRLWADVPEAKDFVRESRPSPDSLAYQPLTGTDPERPKPRSKDELQSLQSELERAALRNESTARKRLGFRKQAAAAAKPVNRQ